MKKKLRRIFSHLLANTRNAKRAFPPDTLKAIQEKIAEGERAHRAEVQVIVEAALSLSAVWSGTTSRHRACALFSHYKIWDTEENVGVLVYVNLADHKVEIIADRSVDRAIQKQEWQTVCHTMTKEFANGLFHHSTLAALEQLNTLLTTHFPSDGDKHNQLPDQPIML